MPAICFQRWNGSTDLLATPPLRLHWFHSKPSHFSMQRSHKQIRDIEDAQPDELWRFARARWRDPEKALATWHHPSPFSGRFLAGCPSLLGWRPSLLGWRPSLLGWRPSLLGWRLSLLGCWPSLLGWRPSLLGGHCY